MIGVVGYGIPFNGFCPCAPDGDGLAVTKYGRTGNNIGTDTQMLHFPDGVSIVLHYDGQVAAEGGLDSDQRRHLRSGECGDGTRMSPA